MPTSPIRNVLNLAEAIRPEQLPMQIPRSLGSALRVVPPDDADPRREGWLSRPDPAGHEPQRLLRPEQLPALDGHCPSRDRQTWRWPPAQTRGVKLDIDKLPPFVALRITDTPCRCDECRSRGLVGFPEPLGEPHHFVWQCAKHSLARMVRLRQLFKRRGAVLRQPLRNSTGKDGTSSLL